MYSGACVFVPALNLMESCMPVYIYNTIDALFDQRPPPPSGCRHKQVAEVRSRFEGEEGGVERFLEVTKRLGFDTRQMDRSNKMFLMAEFKKSNRKPEKGVDFEAKVCVPTAACGTVFSAVDVEE